MFSEKQNALIDYLLKRIGYTDNVFFETYKERLTSKASFFKLFRAKTDYIAVETEPGYEPVYKKVDYVPERYTIIDYLIDEIQVKKNKQLTPKLTPFTQSISATDLANFCFCPASFAISNTWEIEPNLLNVKGKNYHEQAILFREMISEDVEKIENTDPTVRAFFKDIKNSTRIFCGHDSPNQYDFFKSKKGHYTGQPDYIFKNEQSFFVVEEKFKFTYGDSNQSVFFENHKIQLNSYIHGLDHYNIDYGYLVYWHFNRDSDGGRNFNIKVLKLKKNKTASAYLNKIYSDVFNFKNEKKMPFDTKSLNPNKCASCACGRYCGHKTGRYDTLEFPYNEKYLKLYPATYPEILKKKNDDEIDISK